VIKTFKLFIDGRFPRSESGRSLAVLDASGGVVAHACRASRKDVRDAVEAARRAHEKWADATPYLRGQILYRIAEMLEGRRGELADLIAAVPGSPRPADRASRRRARSVASPPPRRLSAAEEAAAAVDRLIAFAGWADKYAHVLGCQNPASGPYYNFTVPEPTGVVAVLAPDAPSLLPLVSLIAPVIVSGNACVALASRSNPLPACVLAEACASGDLPPGVVNILTGDPDELAPHVAAHRDIDAIHAASSSRDALLRSGVAENVKRVTIRPADTDWTDADRCHSPWWIEPFVEYKTIWHPASV
jgi:acyl-CoA reductase-like NAD-dependent aldehyde dehydrogenase